MAVDSDLQPLWSEDMAEIIRAECFPIVGAEPIRSFAASQSIDRDREQQARIAELEAALAKVRDECEKAGTYVTAQDDYDSGKGILADEIRDILNKNDAGGNK